MVDSSILFWCWVVFLLWDTVMLVLIAIPACKAFRWGGNHTMLKVVYQDGVIYYCYIFGPPVPFSLRSSKLNRNSPQLYH
ncbi:hypothetical protein NLJ89_g4534 [Agrocybe chaxingu]|uniref:Uncharacterized protein n=1 Tax=Agrocybe chaxingu TaxID=84603 RepID=A0A9W8K336_9AGAR|nr:hypothetical protein NLJ89_g4534 [Agrocybe chaxingu]